MSNQGNTGRPWSEEEDRLLTEAVHIYGENTEKWKTIATHVPGRTNKACRKRWLHSLSPFVKKSAWTEEEDKLLLSLFEKHPYKWSLIARAIPGRTDDACSKRYQEFLDPALKKDEWTEEEDARLLEFLECNGGPSKPKWRLIGQELKRSGLGCRNRWRLLERKKTFAAKSNALQNGDRLGNTGNEVLSPSATVVPLPVSTANFQPSPTSNAVLDSGFDIALGSRPAQNAEPQTLSHGEETPFSPAASYSQDFSMDNFEYPPDEDNTEYQMIDATSGDASSDSVAPADQVCATASVVHSNGVYANGADASDNIGQMDLDVSVSDQNSPPEQLPAQPEPQQAHDLLLPPVKRRRVDNGVNVLLLDWTEKDAPRLSSTLVVANDPSILAYACGDPACWHSGSDASSNRYPTSGELWNHYKDQHMYNSVSNEQSPFRCGLEGCTKGWKSINGLQYHLQISKAHYRRALSSVKAQNREDQNIDSTQSERASPATGGLEVNTSSAPPKGKGKGKEKLPKQRKVHQCPHDGCLNEYKQMSGLRYHLLHGHPGRPPVQIDTVPPAIARRIEINAKILPSSDNV